MFRVENRPIVAERRTCKIAKTILLHFAKGFDLIKEGTCMFEAQDKSNIMTEQLCNPLTWCVVADRQS